jgi:ketosteroid isomerase-like protein
MSNKEPFAWNKLPEVVQGYLKAHVEEDFKTAVTFLEDDVTVLDAGETLEGRAETLRFFDEAASKYEVATTLNSISRPADDIWEVGTHLSGTFPGGEIDLRMIFTVVDDTIPRLEITV